MTWEQAYKFLGIEDFIFFITNPAVQEALFPVKIVFIIFAAFFFCAVFYFYVNSSYLKYQFFQDVIEFFSWQPYGFGEFNRRWNKIKKMVDAGTEDSFKAALLEADDFLFRTLEDRGYEGKTFEEMVNSAGSDLAVDLKGLLEAHAARNAIVYEPDYPVDSENIKELLSRYENAIKNIATK